MSDHRFAIRTGGFAVYGLAVMGIFTLSLFILGIRDLFGKGIGLQSSLPLLGILLMGWITMFIAMYFVSNKIEIVEDRITFKVQWLKAKTYEFCPKPSVGSIDISDIRIILLGRAAYFEKLAKNTNDAYLENMINGLKGINFSTGNAIPVPLWVALKHTPLLYIIAKKGESFVINTKPFSKSGFKKLFAELQRRNIPTEIQEGVL